MQHVLTMLHDISTNTVTTCREGGFHYQASTLIPRGCLEYCEVSRPRQLILPPPLATPPPPLAIG